MKNDDNNENGKGLAKQIPWNYSHFLSYFFAAFGAISGDFRDGLFGPEKHYTTLCTLSGEARPGQTDIFGPWKGDWGPNFPWVTLDHRWHTFWALSRQLLFGHLRHLSPCFLANSFLLWNRLILRFFFFEVRGWTSIHGQDKSTVPLLRRVYMFKILRKFEFIVVKSIFHTTDMTMLVWFHRKWHGDRGRPSADPYKNKREIWGHDQKICRNHFVVGGGRKMSNINTREPNRFSKSFVIKQCEHFVIHRLRANILFWVSIGFTTFWHIHAPSFVCHCSSLMTFILGEPARSCGKWWTIFKS